VIALFLSHILTQASDALFAPAHFYEERKPLKIEIASTDGKLLIRSDGTGFLSDFVKDTIFIINDSTKTVSALSISVLDGLAKSLSGMMQKSDEDSFEYHMKPMEGTFASAGHIGREYKIALSKDENVHIYLDEKTDISGVKENILSISSLISKMQQTDIVGVFKTADKPYLPVMIMDISGADTLMIMKLVSYEKRSGISIFTIPSNYKFEQ